MANQQGQKRSASQSPTPTPPPSVRARDGSYVDDEETAYLNDEPSFSWSSFEAEQSEFRSPSRSFTSSPSMFSPVPDYPSIPSPPFSQDDEDSSLNGSIEAALNTFTDSVNFAASTFAYTVKQLFINGREQRQVNTASNGTTTSSAAVSTNGHQCSAAEEDNGLNVEATLAAAFSSLTDSVGSSTAASSGSQIFSSNSHHRVNAFNVMSSKLSGGSSGGKQRQVHTSKSSAAGNGSTTNGHHDNSSASAGNANTASGSGSVKFA
ncbi:PREDICTED: uncharacterized protein LOC108354382 [Rhagoletis zephyria]|uniref:uncharacterized protein LOC108354382 n=1 Tax=Rhagoletis zephyria TaxID=28612 RepID=UPI0008113538|nr:PREDICTED: uncharacterized protein LOC108354382 [Rhagoletis zephyria]